MYNPKDAPIKSTPLRRLVARFFLGYVKAYQRSFSGKIYPWIFMLLTSMFLIPVSQSKDLGSVLSWLLMILVTMLVVIQFVLRDIAHDYSRKEGKGYEFIDRWAETEDG